MQRACSALGVSTTSGVMLGDVPDLLNAPRPFGLEHQYALAKADILRLQNYPMELLKAKMTDTLGLNNGNNLTLPSK